VTIYLFNKKVFMFNDNQIIEMKTFPRFFLLFFALLFVSESSFAQSQTTIRFSKKPRNIILFIGDGMGIAHVTAGMTSSREPFNLKQFPFSGFCITQSADDYITDSGAGGTAIACGVKTNNGMIGMAPDNTVVASITEIAHRHGLSTGVLSTSAITHATPASFSAHNISRDNYEQIAENFLNGSVDLFIGGGEDHFRNRADKRDLTAELEKQGFDVVYNLDELKASGSEKIAGLLAKVHMPPVMNRQPGMLGEMTKKAIETLSRDKDGFFLMVEGSMIDWGSHENNLFYAAAEVVDMDKAIGVALDFAGKDRKTLVVVTADHETGGLSLTGGNETDHMVTAEFNTTDHTGTMVPVFSYGPGAEKFSGIHENTFFLDTFLNLLRITR
jgi:alkaline phosphatase